ncbi:asparagine synthase (glutamine-hydrolyzing) [Brevibacillus brevis]|uniref:asparagine synthase (glutamine-hydrolyzing) n=1 Tax=Brevibacillus brevis TaxID=1393 RepID=UPI001F15AF97|nr:asparagine synthase (glutamine-hydrolyzing) [Brevibacillus brevis]UIO40842.1 asparagine synthase (glutamine-hydrolyzing) [Brevibacillus brevis]
MCGIVGWLDWDDDLSSQHAILQKMAQAIQHRGPDEEGYWLSPRAAIAHRRLIVIDPEGGKQPMIYREGDQTCVLSFNGEIYNYLELRRQLELLGHSFQTNSDTEVLLHAFLEWREECVRHLNGIFAFAIWDEKNHRLFLARDHLGVKPLFYCQRGSTFLFGSELKALLAHPKVKPEVEADGLADIIGLGPARTPGFGIFRNVNEVRAGHCVTVTKDQIRTRPYWTLESKVHTDDLDTTTERIRALLQDTVQRQLISDLPLVSMLSGGLDSSGLVALAAEELRKKGQTLQTYSVDFVDNDQHFEEGLLHISLDAPWAKSVSEHVQTRHQEITFNAQDLITHFHMPLRARDLPGLGETDTSLYLFCREMKKKATVSLSGESADEVFNGYPWFQKEKFLNSGKFPWMEHDGWSSFLNEEAIEKIRPQEYLRRRYEEGIAEVHPLEGETALEAQQRKMSYLFITRFLPLLLDRKDRMSMYTGFEVRVPYCDYRLVEYLWNVPWKVKNIDQIEKGLLRRAFKGYLPQEVLYRNKSAYPMTYHPEYYHAILDHMKQILANPNSPLLPLINKSVIQFVLDGKAPMNLAQSTKLIEYLVQINMWLEEYKISIR